jgi:hypothetical protein
MLFSRTIARDIISKEKELMSININGLMNESMVIFQIDQGTCFLVLRSVT